MIPVKIVERPSNYGDFYYILMVPCFMCGKPAEGRVAISRKNEGVSKKIAHEWAEQLRTGQASIRCIVCYQAWREASIAKNMKRWHGPNPQRKEVTQRVG